MRVHVFQHVPFEGPAAIGQWAASKGHSLSSTGFFAGDKLPSPADVDMLAVMGGPMSVNDEALHPWLRAEKAFIRQAVDSGKPVIGVCLGAQLIACALGAQVYRNAHKEIGWLPVRLTPEARGSGIFGPAPEEMVVFHWHGETFDLPRGAIRYASSAACENQAFMYGRKALALQFHLEATPESVHALVEKCAGELSGGEYIQSAHDILSADNAAYLRIHKQLFRILDSLAGDQETA